MDSTKRSTAKRRAGFQSTYREGLVGNWQEYMIYVMYGVGPEWGKLMDRLQELDEDVR